jgi:glycosyltransferase involved in cell wall biosynthesis
MTITRLLYSSTVDISISNGPGVNERGFIKDMGKRFNKNFKAVIPRPSKGLPEDLSKVNIGYLNYFRSSRNSAGWIETRLVGIFRLRLIISEFKPDFIVMRLGALCLPQYFAIQGNSIPFALKTNSDNFKSFYAVNSLRKISFGINEYLVKIMRKKATAIDVANNIQFNAINEKFPHIKNRLKIIENGVDIEMFSSIQGNRIRKKYKIAKDDIVIGYVGSFPMQRGGKEVIDLVYHLHQSFPIKGIIVGDSGEADDCRKYTNDFKISDLVTITGEIDYSEVPDIMSAMDIGLSILRPDKQYASEQKVRQYLASGLCVIGTKGSNDFLKGFNFARVVSGNDITEIIEATVSLIANDRNQLKYLGNRAKQFAKEKLSIESRNNYRLNLWNRSIREINSKRQLHIEKL